MSQAIDTTHRVEVNVATGSTRTEILLGRGVLSNAAAHLGSYQLARLILVSDENVAPLYGAPLHDSLRREGFRAELLTVPAGEEAKTLATLEGLYRDLQAGEVDRGDVIVAVGGGMVGDVAGMLAGTYMRGLEFIQVPTTLVAIITASVGGKAGVNFMGHKNLLGCFKQPALVLADTDTLRSLSHDEFLSGLGELLTVGVLGAPGIFLALEADGAHDLEPLMAQAIRCKGTIVEADPFDRLGVRAKLNLGHTFGHALEALSGFSLPHGLAVAVGLHIATRLAAAIGLCPPELPERIRRVMSTLALPTSLSGYRAEDVIEAMRYDKKRTGGRLRWVLPKTVGEVALVGEEEVPSGVLEEILNKLVGQGQGR